jgi:hypothetical protein
MRDRAAFAKKILFTLCIVENDPVCRVRTITQPRLIPPLGRLQGASHQAGKIKWAASKVGCVGGYVTTIVF